MATNGQANMTEMETFLPKDGSNIKDKYKISVSPAKTRDLEAERLNSIDGKYYDPFKERKVEHPTSDCDTLTHLLKASLGTGILAMPIAFKNAGLTMGIFFTIIVALVCTHCAYIVVKCAHVLYYKTRTPAMSFADVGEAAFTHGPPWGRKFAKLARVSILVGLFLSYFGTCSVYTVIIGNNFQQVIDYHLGFENNQRIYIIALLVPLILMSWVPNLKSLAPVSMVANLFMGLGLGITFYYLVQDLPSPQEMPQVAPVMEWPIFFSICIFAMEAIGVVMPLENSMSNPQHFIGICGVLNQGMGGVTLVYILLGFLGYVKYGDETKGSITLNLPTEDFLAQSVKILVGLAVFCTYGLQYYVCLEIVWNGVKDRFSKGSRMAEYVVRTLLTSASVLLAVAVPTIGPFIGLIGAFCFSLLGLIIPIFIEIVTYWDLGFGACNWIILKNILVFGFGVLALIFGTYTSIEEIAAMYSPVVDEAQDLFNKTAVNATEVFGQLASTVVSSVNVTDTIDKLQSAVGNSTAMAAVLDAFSNGTKTVAEAVLNAGNGTNPLS
ncbi:proton-coupled amino acid transporter-like protein pathetic [Macrosteles quadrilineatus]|uniref:proton-coupled amino acid transporter-like protein pathetic n=1 Tax=Macrosteles quadrilineatus TaxID=74068 RepID=UPI0023E25366|nr:proton-coupled amino acid transporter-like protein pathetic [Macrosteles quadrilineatus]